MVEIRIWGYTDRLSVRPSETIRFMVSAEATDRVRAELVRLVHGDANPEGPGFVEQPVPSPLAREWAVHRQYVQIGNFLRVNDPNGVLAPRSAFTLHAYIFPTLPTGGHQTLLGRWSVDRTAGFALGINPEGRLEFCVGDGTRSDRTAAELPLVAQVWYFVAASYDPASGRATVHQFPVINRYNSLLSCIVPYEYESHVSEVLRIAPAQPEEAAFLLGGATASDPARGSFVTQCYNGKIDRCGVHGAVLDKDALARIAAGEPPPVDARIAYWDTTSGYTDRGVGDTVIDTGPHSLHAEGWNRPVRAQTGWNWNGRNDCFRLAPDQYGGVDFHNDALTDCRWEPSAELVVPSELKSGVYAVKLTAANNSQQAEEYLPFFVRAATPRAAVCLLVPTASYLAYANALFQFDSDLGQAVNAVTPVLQEVDVEAYKRGADFGLSTYDHHNDGTGVCCSSYRRPIFNMRPKYRMPAIGYPWQFPADLSIVGWLDHMGYDWELVTDEDLHREGLDALRPYRVVLTGTHCEYYSEPMLDATEDYVAAGGRLCYLSGNGYYWVVGFRDEEPWIMEVRRLEAGSRSWQARAGEHYLASTGERSGLWRHRNRAPQKLVATGFTSEGMDLSVPFRRMPDSYHKYASWIFDGVRGEVFGDRGLAAGGAAGLEVDRYDLSLGTPPHTLLLASSEPLTDNYPLVHEDVMFMHPGTGGTQHPLVRCDMTYFTAPNNGAVFSASSIAWGSALPSNNYQNDVSRIMKNVVDAFMRPGPLPRSTDVAEEKHWH